MNAMTDPAGLVHGIQHRAEIAPGDRLGAAVHTLRRTGRKAVRFEGWQLIDAVGASGDHPVSHDLNMYRTIEGSIVVELILRRRLPDHQDVYQVKTFEDLPAAAAWLESYPIAADVPIPGDLCSADVALPWAVLEAVQLRQCIDRLQSNYQTLLSEVFAALDLTDPPEIQAASVEKKTACKLSA